VSLKRKAKSDSESTTKSISQILPSILSNIEGKYKSNPSNVLECWPSIIGNELAPMTKVVGLEKGILTVKVKSSTLYSLLNNYEKDKILKKLQSKFSEKIIHKLYFKLG
jgi:hypothetical protein